MPACGKLRWLSDAIGSSLVASDMAVTVSSKLAKLPAKSAQRRRSTPQPASTPPVSNGQPGGQGGRSPLWLEAAVSELFVLSKDRAIVRFGDTLKDAQRDFIAECQSQLESRGQVRICVLKARQIGVSTVIEAILFVLSMMLDDFKCLIVSHEKDSSEGILEMATRYWKTYPFADFFVDRYNGKNHLGWEHGSDIKVATAANENTGRSKTIHGLHLSEVGFYDDPEKMMTGLSSVIPTFGLTVMFYESTANGVGNFFHRECMRAMRGDSDFTFKFYPWWDDPEYTSAFIPADVRNKYAAVSALDDEEVRLVRDFGVDTERLLWRRWYIANKCQGDVEKFHQEMPSTPHEAFISTGRNVFPLQALLNHYEPRRGQRGILSRIGNKVEFMPHERGWLTVFAYPSTDRNWGMYLAGGDPTHTTAGDNACVQVLSRRTNEQVAVYRNKIDPINFGKHMQLIGTYYHDAMLAPEREGPGFATVGCIVGDGYRNVYRMENVAQMPGHVQNTFGWSTNGKTKHLAISHLLKAITDPLAGVAGSVHGLIIHDEVTLMELRDYVTTEDGHGYTNSDGSLYDDGVMALAIAITVDSIEPPPLAFETRAPHTMPANIARKPVDPSTASGPALAGSGPVPDAVPDVLPPDDPGDEADPPWMAWGKREDIDR